MEHNVGDTWMLAGTGLTAPVAVVGATPPVFAPLGSPEHLRGGQLAELSEFESLTDWNWLDLFALGRDSANVVNGWWVNGATDIESYLGGGNWAGLPSGRLALQAEGAEVFYRNMAVRQYPVHAASAGRRGAVRWLGPGRLAIRGWSGPVEARGRSDGGGARDGRPPHTEQLRRRPVARRVQGSGLQRERGRAGPRGTAASISRAATRSRSWICWAPALAGANDCGAIYGVKDADVNEAFPPGIWQSYDMLFRAARWNGSSRVAPARITLVWNGSLVQRDIEIPGSTTLGDPEGPGPAPLRLQDHGHAVQFRNMAEPL